MKLLGSILIIVSFSLFGIYKSYSLSKRCKNLSELKSILQTLKTEISFLQKDLSQALLSASSNTSLSPLFSCCVENLKTLSLNDAWKKSLEDNFERLHFTENEIDVLKKLTHSLGKTDSETQIQHIDFISSLIFELYENASNEFKLKGNIYKSGGVSLGILTVLILI